MAEFARETGGEQGQWSIVGTAKQFERGAGEQFKCRHSGSRVAGKAEEEFVAGTPKDKRLARLDENTVEIEFGAQRRERGFNVVVLSGRDAAGKEQQVLLEAILNRSAGSCFVIGNGGQEDRVAARALHLRGKRPCVRIAHLTVGRILLDGHDFVARGQNGDLGPPEDTGLCRAYHCQRGDVDKVHACAAWNDYLTHFAFGASRVNEFSWFRRPFSSDVIDIARDMLDHDDLVRAARNRRASHDLDGHAGTDLAGESSARTDFADDAERTGQVHRAHGKSIADGTGDGREIAIGSDLLHEHAAGGIAEADHFCFWRGTKGAHTLKNEGARVFKTVRGHSRHSKLERVPHRLTLRQMIDSLRSGRLTPTELMESHIAAIERGNPAINAFTELCLEQARNAARAPRPGPLSGIPVTIKASLAYDSTVARRLRHAGAIILGRTNTPPFLMNYETDNSGTGRTNNPLDPALTPGGSSGGEAAAIAACFSAGGIGSDGGGSIRWPAHCCRIAGLKPTPGRVPGTGHTPEIGHPGGLLGVVGPMARTVDDLAVIFEAVAGYDSADPLSSPVLAQTPPAEFPPIALIDAWPVEDSIHCRLRRAARLLGARQPIPALMQGTLNRAHELWRFFFWRVNWLSVKPLVQGKEGSLHPLALEWFAAARVQGEPSAHEVLVNLAARDRLRAHFLDAMEQYPVLLCAPATIEAFPHGDRSRFSLEAVRPLSFANLLGLPALVTNTGVQLVGRPYEEETLLAIGRWLEEEG